MFFNVYRIMSFEQSFSREIFIRTRKTRWEHLRKYNELNHKETIEKFPRYQHSTENRDIPVQEWGFNTDEWWLMTYLINVSGSNNTDSTKDGDSISLYERWLNVCVRVGRFGLMRGMVFLPGCYRYKGSTDRRRAWSPSVGACVSPGGTSAPSWRSTGGTACSSLAGSASCSVWGEEKT